MTPTASCDNLSGKTNKKSLEKLQVLGEPTRRWSTAECPSKGLQRTHHLPALRHNTESLKSTPRQSMNPSLLAKQLTSMGFNNKADSSLDNLLTVDSYLSGQKVPHQGLYRQSTSILPVQQNSIHRQSTQFFHRKRFDKSSPTPEIKSARSPTIILNEKSPLPYHEEESSHSENICKSTIDNEVAVTVAEETPAEETATIGPVVHEEFSTLFELQLADVRKALERKEDRKELLLNKNISEERMNVLRGKCDNLPPIPTGQVRLYLSGSVTDMKTERLGILKASQKVATFCRRAGIDFHIVDLRWAITADAQNEHNLTDLMKEELLRCKRLSIGHHFACLLGSKYGYRPLPSRICENHWEIIKKFTKDKSFEHWNLMQDWYLLDENNIPPVYILQPINSKLQYFLDSDIENADFRERDRKEWRQIYLKIRQLLVRVSTLAHAEGLFSDEVRRSYVGSVTDIELHLGVFENEFKTERSMVYDRTVKGLKTAENQNFMSIYIDTMEFENKTIQDWEATNAIKDLKYRTSKNLMGHNYRCYVTEFANQVLQLAGQKGKGNYIANYTSDFIEDCTHFIENCVESEHIEAQKDVEFNEILHHAIMCESLYKSSPIERTSVLKQIKELLLQEDPNRHPYAIYGESGVGKSCICAKIAKLIPDWLGEDTIVLIRFVATSTPSCNVIDLLHSICYQLSAIARIPLPKVVMDVSHLSKTLISLIKKIEETIVIILDGIDEIDNNQNAHELSWLPGILPDGVFIIVSLSDGVGSNSTIIRALNDKMPEEGCEENFLKVDRFNEEEAKEMIDYILNKKNRVLTPEQRSVIDQAISNCSNSLYLKLLMDEAVLLKSYNALDFKHVACNVRLAIGNLFKNLECHYGKETIKYALSYITVCRGGVTATELEDLLSMNDDILDEVYRDLHPPFEHYIRIPTLHWVRIRHHIDDFLLETHCDGKLTLTWFHKEFRKVVKDKYLTRLEDTIHKHISDMFLQESELRRTIILKHRKVTIENADRLIRPQKTIPGNRRKLNCLPYHLARSKEVNPKFLDIAKCKMFFSLKWIIAKFIAYCLDEVISDIERFKELLPVEGDIELNLIEETLKDCRNCENIELDPGTIPRFIYESLKDKTHFKNVESLINECENWVSADDKYKEKRS
ncbi:DgyrCDS8231 [Dimorphilus gyrociliatus]|uniref:DgyrCDS8231 n=1 Tax=Dimorphilus gyrociliatus TaxID=2664684 RepID=A0A7I8VVY0_9ANNE|nr:DgyrCDS8231 [Dimorphilus gyrociliatus]